MRTGLFLCCLAAVLAAGLCLVGCGPGTTQTPSADAGGTPGPADPAAPAAQPGDHTGPEQGDQDDHTHPDEGPRGGHLIELGNEEYHAELLHDHATHTVTVCLLDAAGKQPVAVSAAQITLQLLHDGQFVDYALKAAPEPDDPQGAASRFEIVDEQLCHALAEEDHLQGRLRVTIDERPYTGMIDHAAHGDHDDAAHHPDDHDH